MTTVIQSVSSDTYVRATAPSANEGGVGYLGMELGGTGGTKYAFVYFNRPFPLGVTVGPTFLRLYQRGSASGGSRTLTVRRAEASWKESTLTYANRPPVTGDSASSAAQGDSSLNGRLWEIDITALMQQVADGAAWYGLRIESNNATFMTVYSSEADDYQPEVEVSWSEAPQTPTVLSPSNGRAVSIARPTLRFDFTDHSGDMTMQGYRVLMNLGGPDEVTPDYDSGDLSATLPEHLVTFDVAAAADWWWAVETIDGAGLHSELSEWVNFTRTAKPTVVIDNPAGFVSEGTPPILWTVTGGVQAAYQVFLTDPVVTATVLWTSGKVTSADDSLTIPLHSPPLLSPGATYGLTVRIWDTVAREATPGDPVYKDVSTTFTFDLTTDVAPVTALAVVASDAAADATVTWTSATAPDSFTIMLDGLAYEVNVDPADALAAGTSYSWVLKLVAPRVEHEVSVYRVVDGETSDANPTATFTIEPKGIWLSTLDGLHTVNIAGPDPSMDPSELSVVRKPLGATNPVLITQSVYGREGKIDGELTEYADTTLAEALAEWEAITDRNVYPGGTPMALTMSDTSTRVFIYNTVRGIRNDEFYPKIPVRFDFCELL